MRLILDEETGMGRIEKMFIIEFVVKIIINESDIGITKKRVYMLLMLRSLLSMFNLFEDGITHSEKNSFVKLLDMLNQLLLFLKTEFKQKSDDFLKIWTEKGLFKNSTDGLVLSDKVLELIHKKSPVCNELEKKENFLEQVRDMIQTNESKNKTKVIKMKTRVICESEIAMKKLTQKRKSILPTEDVFGTEIERIISDQFISVDTFDNECKVVFNLILNNCHSTIVLTNFQKLNFMLLKMEELTITGVLTSFKMQNILSKGQAKPQPRVFNKLNRKQKSRITRFTDLRIPDFKNESLFKEKSVYEPKDFINPEPVQSVDNSDIFKKKKITNMMQDDNEMFSNPGFPNWLLSCLEIVKISNVEGLIFRVLEFFYSMLDWEKCSTFTLSVRYNNLLYKDRNNYSTQGIFWVILVRLFDLMEVSAYKKVALNYFMSFVMENCEFVINFIRNKLANSTARDFRQIASLWKNTSQQNSSTIRKLLGETVFDMLNYADGEDPLVRNYFKNWLQYSQKDFYLILNKLLKKLYQQTHMNLQNGDIVYNYLFSTAKFNGLLRLLKSVFTNGGNSFINFIRKTNISDEFGVFDIEMNTLLENFYQLDCKKYYSFMIKMLLCYLLSDPSKDLNSQFLIDTNM